VSCFSLSLSLSSLHEQLAAGDAKEFTAAGAR